MSDNPQGLDVATDETTLADDSIPTDDAVTHEEAFYGVEDDAVSNDTESSEIEESADADSEVESYSFTLKADGEEHVLTSEEKVREYASKGIKFYNEMERLATDRKQFEAQKQEQESKLADSITKLESFLEAQPELDIDELGADEYVKQKEKREAATKALTEAQKEQQAQHEAKVQEYTNQEINLLAERMGSRWNDTEVMNSDIKAAKEWMKKEFGATDEELSTAINHKFWHMGIKGAQLQSELDKFNSKKQAVQKEIKRAPKTVNSNQAAQQERSLEDTFYGT